LRTPTSSVRPGVVHAAAKVVPNGSTLLVILNYEEDANSPHWVAATQAARLAILLKEGGGGDVAIAATGKDSARKRIDLGRIQTQFTVISGRGNKTSRRHHDSASMRNLALEAAQEIAEKEFIKFGAVLFAESKAKWCAHDGMRLIANLAHLGNRGVDIACAASENHDALGQGAVMGGHSRGPGGRGVHLSYIPRGIDSRYETTCSTAVRASPSDDAPRDAWTGDLIPHQIFDGSSMESVVWPALVLSCWAPLTSVSATHLFPGNVVAGGAKSTPPLRFRTAVKRLGECDSTPTAIFVLDVHRRVQEAGFGDRAIVVLDRAVAVSLKGSPSPNVAQRSPDRAATISQLMLALPSFMPADFRCCERKQTRLGCSWRKTFLDTTHDKFTAKNLELASKRQESQSILSESAWLSQKLRRSISPLPLMKPKIDAGLRSAGVAWVGAGEDGVCRYQQ